MRKELYKKIVEKYEQMYYHELKVGPKGSGNFNHTASNLICSMMGYSDSIEQYKEMFLRYLKATRTYFNLIKKFPQFRKAEFTIEKGFFPDITDFIYSENGKTERKKTGITSLEQYVFSAKQRLEDIARSVD